MDTNNDILLIDAGHLYNGGKAIKQPFDFEKWSILIDLLQSHFKITYHRRKMFNSVRDPATAESNHFHVAAKRAKIDVILSGLKKVLCFCQKNGCNCPHKKGGEALVREMQAGVDVALAAHGMHEYHLGCRSITFVTGDGDFKEVLNLIGTQSKTRIYVCGFKFGLSADLIAKCSDYVYLDDFWPNLSFKKKIGGGQVGPPQPRNPPPPARSEERGEKNPPSVAKSGERGEKDKIANLAKKTGVDEETACALLAAADGDIDTAVAIYCGYNGGDVSRAGNLSDLAESEGDKRERADDPETRRAREYKQQQQQRLQQQRQQRTPEEMQKISQLKEMGFEEQKIISALERSGWDVDNALSVLFQ